MIDVVAALIFKDGRFLICKRPKNKARGGLWEFPGGKTEPLETHEQALFRECREELAVEISVGEKLMTVIYEYPDVKVSLSLFLCSLKSGSPHLLEHSEMCWITASQLDDFDFCPADAEILKMIKKRFCEAI